MTCSLSNLARLIVNIIMKVKLFTLALVTLTAGLLASCKKADLTTSVTGVTLDKTTLEIAAGDADVKLTATISPENATDKTVSWASDKTDIATVDQEGKVHAVAPGAANITVTTTDGGKTASCAIIVIPEGALPGEFSVSATKKVRFSRGNLVAAIDATGAPTAWKFAANQYDCLGEGGTNTTIGSQAGDVDLFGWSTPSSNYGISTTLSGGPYLGEFVDWGKAYCGQKGLADDTWRTLTSAEWQYLFDTRTVNGDIKEGHSYQRAYINSTGTADSGVYGMILYPDNYTSQTAATNYTSTEWAAMEVAGCIFLPAAGSRFGSIVEKAGSRGFYWSSSGDNFSAASCISFEESEVKPDNANFRNLGFSVRLVTEAK